MTLDLILQILGFSIGLAYLYWEYHADARVWIASVIMPAISMWIYFSKGLYADFSINIYYLLIAVYGYIHWTRHGKSESKEAAVDSGDSGKKDKIKERENRKKDDKKGRAVTHLPVVVGIGCAAATGVLWWLIWMFLTRFTDSTVPVADAFTTALSIVGLWMMARKYAQQWLAWLVVDMVCTVLYFYKGIPFYGVLYALYSVIAVFGYRKWLRLIGEVDSPQK